MPEHELSVQFGNLGDEAEGRSSGGELHQRMWDGVNGVCNTLLFFCVRRSNSRKMQARGAFSPFPGASKAKRQRVLWGLKILWSGFDPGAGGQVAVNKGAAALPQWASPARAWQRGNNRWPTTPSAPMQPAAQLAPGPPLHPSATVACQYPNSRMHACSHRDIDGAAQSSTQPLQGSLPASAHAPPSPHR